ncbi:adhesion G protein-coupled receptor G3-like isoform X2 [Sander vitreus]
MVSLLLSMLLSTSLADQVQLNIVDGSITVTMNETNILDEMSGYVRCMKNTFPCLFQCTVNETLDIPSLSHFDANVTIHDSWVEYSMTQNISCSLYLCKNYTILKMIQSLASQDSEAAMMKLFYIRDSCPDLFSSDHEVMTAFISMERNLIHDIMGTSQIETEGSINYDLKGLSLNVLNFSEAELTNSEIKIEAPQLLPQNTSFIPDIWLPADALHAIPKEKRIIGLFKQEEISSMVLRIEVLDEDGLKGLKTPIKMTFRTTLHTAMDNDSWLQCHYFDERDWIWKTDGCVTNDTQTDITCNCNHATPFAVLLIRGPISEIHWQILSNISYIGCGLSALFTALSLVIYVFGRNQEMDYSMSIHVSLSGALLLLNTTFLLTEWGATVEPAWVCVFVAALMHYSLLCCFTWMAIEALHLYLLLIKVFNTYFKHYMVKLSLAGWGIPGVIVAVSVGMTDFKQFYGLTEMTMADTNQTNAICWITDDSYFYSLNLVYFTLIFMFNSGILLVVASNICKMKQVFRSTSKLGAKAQGKLLRDSKKFDVSCRNGLTVMGITCLMGTTWGLAFLGSGYVNYPILYLFCILNSAQGFFIFLWICLSAKKQRKRHMEDRLSSTAVTTSAVKFD